jgi:hypothetical protein
MGTDGVIDLFPLAELTIEFFHLQRARGDLVELLGVGAVGALDGAVEFGRTGRKHEQMEATLLAGEFKLGGELGTAIDLHGADGEGHAVLQRVEELSRGLGGGAGVGLNHVPAGDHVTGGELFEDDAGYGTHVQGIDFDQIAGAGDRVLFGFAHGVGTGAQGAARSRNTGAGRFDQAALLLQLRENAAHHGSRNRHALAAQEHGEFVLAPAGNCNRKVKTFSAKGKVQVGWRWR